MTSAVLGLLERLALQAWDGRSRQKPLYNLVFRNYLGKWLEGGDRWKTFRFICLRVF